MTTGLCLVDGCGRVEQLRRGLCNLHRMRLKMHGDVHKRLIRPSGQGSIRTDGYCMYEINGRSVLRHILIAEKALGKRLPKGAQVHHVDGNRGNDSPENLVICPSSAYHQLLHKRQHALDACGHADWRQCSICKAWSPASDLTIYKPSGNKWHPKCRRDNPVRARAR